MTFRPLAAIDAPAHDAVPWGTALDWSMWLTIIAAAMILVLVAVSVVFYRGRQTHGGVLWLHLLSLAILPMFLLAVGNFTVFEYAKEETFCGSCHQAMKPFTDDLRNGTSSSLAALHYQSRFAPGSSCYACHANYGVHATFQAKKTGLRHVYKYTLGNWELPIKMREPFDNALCLKCHEGAKRFMAEPLQLDAQNNVDGALVANNTTCISCHGPAHPNAPKRGVTS